MTASRVLVRLPSMSVNATRRHVSDAAMAITKPKTTRAMTLIELGTRGNKPRTNAPRTLTKRPLARARTRFHIGRASYRTCGHQLRATCVAASSRVEPGTRPWGSSPRGATPGTSPPFSSRRRAPALGAARVRADRGLGEPARRRGEPGELALVPAAGGDQGGLGRRLRQPGGARMLSVPSRCGGTGYEPERHLTNGRAG